ncbi:MAG: hypothetical protein ACYC54_00135 [Sedimentisphaerales bacterium]
MRGLTDNFVNQLQCGLLTQILVAVKSDSTLCLEIRENYINIYYRGGNVIKIQENDGVFNASFDRKYLDENTTRVPNLPCALNNTNDIGAWLNAIPFLKHEMDLWFGRHPKDEREFQQLMLRENNLGNSAKGTDYFICDIEYANHTGRFDLIAVKWPSSSIHRKNNNNLGLTFIEMKCLDNALTGSAGLCKHVEDINIFLNKSGIIETIKEEMKLLFNQKLDLGLINNQKPISSFSDDKPELILVLINHDPASSILRNELKRIPDCPNAEIKIATSNFMGYGLYLQSIYSLNEFLNKFEGNI